MSWWTFLRSSASYSGPDGILNLLSEHLAFSGFAMLIVILIALPLGAALGHFHTGSTVVLGLANVGRAIPSFGVIVIFAVSAWGLNFATMTITLVLFALPQVLTNTYTGVAEADISTVQAARGIGMGHWDVLWRVELPSAVPLIASGIRSAAVQTIAVATIAGYAGAGGLGQIIFRAYASNLPGQQIGGAILVVGLALVVQIVLGLMQRAVTPVPMRRPGVIFRNRVVRPSAAG
jgi:osmoprotectant transport system permease protein